jgi:TetR/AcrR family transcriptional regulator
MVKSASSPQQETCSIARLIARVAARLFASRGYDATPVRAIVEAAGVTKPTLYYHFGSKEGLAQALLTEPMTRFVAGVRDLVAHGDDPVRTLEAFVEAHFAFCREDPDRARFWYALFFGPLGSELSAELGQFGEELAVLTKEVVARAADAGIVDRSRASECTVALRGLIVIHTMDYLYRGDELGPTLAHRLVADLLRGFGTGAAAAQKTAPGRSRTRSQI